MIQIIKKIQLNTLIACAMASICAIFFMVLCLTSFDWFDEIDLNWLTQRPLAHRGMYGEQIPENSLLAFQNAIDNDYGIELDVKLTKDGVPIVFHDFVTDRMTDEAHFVSSTTYATLSQLKLKNSDQTIPTLREALELIDGKVPVLVDVKAHIWENLNAILDELLVYQGDYAMQFFSPIVFRWFASRAPQIPLGMVYGSLVINQTPILQLRDNLFSLFTRPNFVTYESVSIKKMNMNQYRERGLVVLGFTLSYQELQEKEFSNYFDNIILGFN